MSGPRLLVDVTDRWRTGRGLLAIGLLLALVLLAVSRASLPRWAGASLLVLVAMGAVASALLTSLRGHGVHERRALYVFLALATRLLSDEVERAGFPAWPVAALFVGLMAISETLSTGLAAIGFVSVLMLARTSGLPEAAALLAGHGLLFSALHFAVRADRRRFEAAHARLLRLEKGLEPIEEAPVVEGPRLGPARKSLQQITGPARQQFKADRASALFEALQRLTDVGCAALRAHAVLYFEVDRARDTAWLRAGSGPDALVRDAMVPLGADPFGFVLARRQAFYATDFKRLLWELPWYRGQVPVGSLLAQPVLTGDVVIGVLLAERLEVQAFGDEEPRLLAAFAELCAHEVARVRAAMASDQLGLEFNAVYSVSQQMSILTAESPVLQLLLRVAHEVSSLDGAAVAMLDTTRTSYEVREASGWARAVHGRTALVSDRTWAAWVLRGDDEALLIDDLQGRDERLSVLVPGEGDHRPESLLAVPLRVQSRTVGVLVLTGPRGAFDTVVRRVFLVLANQAAVQLWTLELIEEREKLAMNDALTGLRNRRHFGELLDNELSRGSRHHNPFSLVLVDVDHFKRVNDTYGHPAGDAVLKSVAARLRSHLRLEDAAARIGGEEFALILPATSLSGALQMAERLRAAIEESEEVFGGARLKVTASFGVAVWPEDGRDATALMQAADRALYAAKQGGRNRVVIATQAPAGAQGHP